MCVFVLVVVVFFSYSFSFLVPIVHEFASCNISEAPKLRPEMPEIKFKVNVGTKSPFLPRSCMEGGGKGGRRRSTHDM